MKHTESNFIGLKDTQIYYQSWLPDDELDAILIIVHGFGEHSGRYGNVVDALLPHNIGVYALDHRGHGQSEGRMNYINRFDDYLTDLATFEKIVRETHQNEKFFLLGHSMGSLIATHYIANHPNQQNYQSLVLSGTGADFGPGINKVTIILGKVLSVLAPKLSIPSNLDPEFISRDPNEVEKYMNDPLVNYEKITARLAAEMMKHTDGMEEAAKKITIPTLIQIGSEDETFASESRKTLYDAISNENKQLKIYEGYRHEVFNEVNKEVVLEDLTTWLINFI